MEQVFLKRINEFYQWMKENQLNATVITSPANVYYFTNFYSNPHERFMGLFLLENEEPILILPALDVHEAKEKIKITKRIYGYADHEGPEMIIQQYVASSHERALGFEENQVSYKKASWLKSILKIKDTFDIEEGINQLRLTKDSLEINYLKEAAEWADKAVEYGIEAIKPGRSELEVIASIEYKLKQQGIEKMSFDTMVLTGLKSAAPHGKPGKETIQKGDLVLFDLGVKLNGYCSDISRTVAVGNISEKQKEIYSVVQQAQELAIKSVKAGVPIKNIDLAAREFIQKAGYGEYFMHRTGHGLGIEVHEYPSIHEKNEILLKKGMVFTIEPGIYLPEVGGVRIEDDIVATEEDAYVLTSFTKDLIILT